MYTLQSTHCPHKPNKSNRKRFVDFVQSYTFHSIDAQHSQTSNMENNRNTWSISNRHFPYSITRHITWLRMIMHYGSCLNDDCAECTVVIPTFNQFMLSSSASTINRDGIIVMQTHTRAIEWRKKYYCAVLCYMIWLWLLLIRCNCIFITQR